MRRTIINVESFIGWPFQLKHENQCEKFIAVDSIYGWKKRGLKLHAQEGTRFLSRILWM